jgi:multidrug efflux system membrane fusion protein
VSILVVVIVVVGLAALLAYCGRTGGAHEGGPPGAGGAQGRHGRGGAGGGAFGGGARPPTTVGVAKATLGSIPITQTALGTVTPMATVQVNARVSGQLFKVGFQEGQMVKKGQLLMQIDPRPYQVALQQAQATLAHDQALLTNARLDLNRYSVLKAQNSIATQTYDTQVATVQQDEATVKQDEAAVASAKLNLTFTRITAPVSGRAGLRQIDVGNQVVSNESTPVTVITQIDPITIIFPLPEDAIGGVMAHHGGAGLKVTALDRSDVTVLGEGRLLALDNAVNTSTGTVNGRAEFKNADGKLFPFQFVNITLLVDTLENQVIVPTTAVRHGPNGDYVWVLQPNRTVKQRPVKTGPGTPETVSIVSGLQAGESVITDGGDRLRDDAPVILPGQHGGYGGGGRHQAGQGAYGGAAGASAAGASAAGAPGPAGSAGSAGSANAPATRRYAGADADQASGDQTPPAAGPASPREACRADVSRLCASEAAGQDRDAIRACMRQNMSKLSAGCRAALKAQFGGGQGSGAAAQGDGQGGA